MYITRIKSDLEAEGWILLPHDERYPKSGKTFGMYKDNFMMGVDLRGTIPYFQILLKDPSLWCDKIHNPENWRVTVRLESIEQFRQLEKLINN